MKAVCIFTSLVFSMCSCSNMQVSGADNGKLNTESNSLEVPINRSTSNKIALNIQDYMRYVMNPDNGLLVNKQIGDFKFSLLYKPDAFVVLSNLGMESINKSVYEKELLESKDLQYFTCKINIEGNHEEFLKYKLQNIEEYERRVDYFAFHLQQDLKVIEGKDTLDCVLYHFERNYGVAPNITFVLGFNKPDNEDLVYDKTFSYDERVFGLGKVNITINKENIIGIPELKLN